MRTSLRLGGIALVVGAATFIVYVIARSFATAGPDAAAAAREALWAPLNALGVLGAALVLLGLPAVYAPAADAGGRPGLVGTALITLAWMFFGLFLSLYGALVEPWLASKAPSLLAASAPLPVGFIVAFLTALLADLAGSVLLAIPFLQGRAQPRWVGYLLPLSALWMVAGDLVASGGPAGNLALNLLSNLGPVLLLLALGDLGWRLCTAPTSGS